VLACYDLNGVYRFTGGVNLVAIGCMVAGMIVWLFLGGWLSGSSALTFAAGQTLFQYISATLPSMIVGRRALRRRSEGLLREADHGWLPVQPNGTHDRTGRADH
jgi:hypothetical protein